MFQPMLPYVAPSRGLDTLVSNLTHSLRCGLLYGRQLRWLSHSANISIANLSNPNIETPKPAQPSSIGTF